MNRLRSGMALLVMLAALALLGAFSLLAGRLLLSSMTAVRLGQEAQTRTLRTEGMLSILRQDVWNASSIEAIDGGLRVQRAGGGEIISWLAAPEGLRRQIEGKEDEAQLWIGLGQAFDVQIDGPLVMLKARPVRGSGVDEVPLVSQVMLGKGSGR